MNTIDEILKILIRGGGYVSGEEIAEKLNMTRAAVSKNVGVLKKRGCNITAKTNGGYKYEGGGGISAGAISARLSDEPRGEIIVLDEVKSTNDYLKELAERGENVAAVIAKKQSGGRGRFSRPFYSPENIGVYMSVLLKAPLDIRLGVKITSYAATMTARAIEKFTGGGVGVKWVNDLYMNGRKICGILTEAVVDFETQKLKYAIVGIGINVLDGKFPEELSDIATSIEKESGVKIDLNDLIAEIIKNSESFEREILSGDFFEEYKRRSILTGQKVRVVSGTDDFTAAVLSISDSGALIVDKNGETVAVNAGDVSVRMPRRER